ncbi:hypothetical protein K438DRAFT_1753859 [Mycena galopus ATCC 62051]|nr:hypothetical protein K438DRAFT_1753859 [Mycena galopus ATCC 62051]
MNPAMRKILEGERFKIKLLECSAGNLGPHLGSQARTLFIPTCLMISGGGDDLPGITSTSLSNASGNCIAKVVINIQGDNVEDWDDDGMTLMDSVLSSSIVPAARCQRSARSPGADDSCSVVGVWHSLLRFQLEVYSGYMNVLEYSFTAKIYSQQLLERSPLEKDIRRIDRVLLAPLHGLLG